MTEYSIGREKIGGVEKEVRTLELNSNRGSFDLGPVFEDYKQETLLGVTNDGHFYMVHEGFRIDAKPFRPLQVRESHIAQSGMILRFADLSTDQRLRLRDAVAKLKSKRVASCSSGVCQVLSEAGIEIPGTTDLSRIFTAGTFEKLLGQELKGYDGAKLSMQIYQTAPEIIGALKLQLRTQDFMRPVSYVGILVVIVVVIDQLGIIDIPVLF